ncbi:MAG: mechanosensitive ion channel [Spirochaetales bacterium]|nr:mechanosensitive ion channel [Spirochaetales bacterium]
MESAEKILSVFREVGEISLVRIVLIVAAAWVLLAIDQRLLPRLARKLPGKLRFHLLALVPMIRLAIIVVAGVLILLRLIEPTLENMVALFGFLGVGLGFAVKDYAASIVAGTVALYEMPYRPGDWISVEGVYGEVKSLEFRAVHMVTPDDTLVIIPHKKLWDTSIHNANNGSSRLQCVADFYVTPDHDGARLRARLRDVALTSPYIQLACEPKVVSEGTPWATHYRIRAYPMDPDQQFAFVTDLTERGNAAIARLGVGFASPGRWPPAA